MLCEMSFTALAFRRNFELNERERFSHRTRSSAYDQRFRRAYNELDDNQKYRASYIIAERLVAIDVGNQDRLNGSLNNIGWRIEDGKLMAELPEVRELFFPPGSQYDAYSGIKRTRLPRETSISLPRNSRSSIRTCQ